MNAPITVEQLVADLIAAKAAEAAANKHRVELETQIINILGFRQDGAQTTTLANGLKVTITGKMSITADIDKLVTLAASLPSDMRPIKTEPRLDETGAKWLLANQPNYWRIIAPAITVKPAKTSVTIKA